MWETTVKSERSPIASGYGFLLRQIKQRIRVAQSKAVLAANQEMILLYWDIG